MTSAQVSGRQALLEPLAGGDPRLPRLVVYTDDGRTELSGATLANWTAKVAGLLGDELGAVAGDVATVRLPAGWQTAPILLGAWWRGMTVTDTDGPSAIAAFVPDGADAAADEVLVVSGHPLGAPSTRVAAHQRDFTTAALPQADRLGAIDDPDGRVPVIQTAGTAITAAELLDLVRRAASELTAASADAPAAAGTLSGGGAAAAGPAASSGAGASSGGGAPSNASPSPIPPVAIPPTAADPPAAATSSTRAGSRRPVLLSVVDWSLPHGVAATLLATLVAGGTLVQCPASWDTDRLNATARSEHATATVGVVLDGLPALQPDGPAT